MIKKWEKFIVFEVNNEFLVDLLQFSFQRPADRVAQIVLIFVKAKKKKILSTGTTPGQTPH